MVDPINLQHRIEKLEAVARNQAGLIQHQGAIINELCNVLRKAGVVAQAEKVIEHE